jgi:hypothetical protein
VLDQSLPHLPHLQSRGPKKGQWSTCPDQHADVDALGKFGEKIAKDYPLAVALEREVRRKVPSGQMNVRACLSQFRHHRREGLRAVDENVDRVTGPHRRLSGRPTPGRGLERTLPPDPSQATLVVVANLPADLIAEPALGCEEETPKLADRLGRGRFRVHLTA